MVESSLHWWSGERRLLAALDEVLDQTIAGTGRTILLGGEAGVGKTPPGGRGLSGEPGPRHGDPGKVTAWSRSRVLPYRPVLDLLRALLAGRSAKRRREDSSHAPRPMTWPCLLPEQARPLTSGVRAPGGSIQPAREA